MQLAAKSLIIPIADNGMGMTEAVKKQILDFSRKEGMGMEAMGNREKQFIISGSGLISCFNFWRCLFDPFYTTKPVVARQA